MAKPWKFSNLIVKAYQSNASLKLIEESPWKQTGQCEKTAATLLHDMFFLKNDTFAKSKSKFVSWLH